MNHQVRIMLRPHFDKCELILLPQFKDEPAVQVGVFDTELDALIRMREQWLPRLPLHSPWLASLPATVNILTNSVTYDLTQAVADMNRFFLLYPSTTNIDPDAKPETTADRAMVRLAQSARDHHHEWEGHELAGSRKIKKSMHWWNGLTKADRNKLHEHGVMSAGDITVYYDRCIAEE